jgi:hypothetical protein
MDKNKITGKFVAHEYTKMKFKEIGDTANFELLLKKAIIQKLLEEEADQKSFAQT